jgi:hypothetical protein
VLLNPSEDYYKNYRKNLEKLNKVRANNNNGCGGSTVGCNGSTGNDNQCYLKEELELKTNLSIISDVTAF